ncbi:autotransporter domain-containing protein [Bradyrhizobium sp. STM 3562]|uniref:autotransporter outer membrane beta-barrel domain-containing protein n=1 Tax=Bradyrhizobium sp. STM 3562 TaxID=578924 RepID=UPI00388E546A
MLTIENGGTLSALTVFVGQPAGSQGTVTVSGPGSTLTTTGAMAVGVQGQGMLTISNGAVVTNIATSLGLGAGGTGTLNLNSGGTLQTAGLVVGSIPPTPISSTGVANFDGGTLRAVPPAPPPTVPPPFFIGGFSTGELNLLPGGLTIDSNGLAVATDTTSGFSGVGGLTKEGSGMLTLNAANTYSGPTAVNAGTLQAGIPNAFAPGSAYTIASGATLDLNSFNQTIGSLAGAGNVTLGSATLTTGGDNTSTTFSGAISGSGEVNKVGGGTWVLSGDSPGFTGSMTVDGGTVEVDGSIAGASVTVHAGDTLGGTGTVGATTIRSGGTLAPGNAANPTGTLTVNGSLAFESGAFYLVQVNSSTASLTNVTGTATLAGTVVANVTSGSAISKRYDILHSAGLGGTTFDALVLTDPNFRGILTYSATDVFLDLTAAQLGTGLNLTRNQQSVANALNNFFNSGGTLPPAFGALFGLTGGNLTHALDQVSGEAATGAQQAAFQLGDQFLNVMLDPFVDGRCGIGGTDYPPLGYPPDCQTRPSSPALAYASMYTKAPPMAPPVYVPHWSVWGAGYGGGNHTDGDAVIGSHDLSARAAGFATGFDYHLAPNSVVGFALAAGGTNWSLSQGLGGGRSDALQAGIYGATRWGPAYFAGDFAFTNHWMSTDRLAFEGDHLTADFNAQSYGGRLEGGYRFATPFVGIAPYAAIQAQSFHTPSYSEIGTLPDGFALAFGSRNATDTRSELGARFDQAWPVFSDAVVVLRGRLAWAHDWVSDPTLTPLFQSLPGASFVVNGATPPQDSALTSLGAELRFANHISLLAKFDGQFASNSQTYAGTGTIRYTW